MFYDPKNFRSIRLDLHSQIGGTNGVGTDLTSSSYPNLLHRAILDYLTNFQVN